MNGNNKKNLIIIGGAEDKKEKKEILNFVADKLKETKGNLLIATIATESPSIVIEQYRNIFSSMGIRDIKELRIVERKEAFEKKNLSLVEEASVIFFTGGDQLRITSLVGGTPLYDALKEKCNKGCYFVGTSAGASVMSEVMIVGGEEEESPRKSTLNMSAGLGLIDNTLIDQHFAQRGRIGRLLSGVCQNPEVLGIGIDEDTAIVINDDELTVIGNGSVYFVDGRDIRYTNVSEKKQDEVFSIFNIKLHVLTAGKKMNLLTRVPFEEERNKNENK